MFARAAYVMFGVAVLLALLKLDGFSGAESYFLKMVPAIPVAKAAQPVTGDGEVLGDEVLDLPNANASGRRTLVDHRLQGLELAG